jgi:Bacterial regulatory protein, Fis family
MGRLSPHAPISSSSRRRLARWLVGSPIRDVERDLVLETLASTHGNRTASAHLLGVSVRTLRNKITEYSAEGLDIPRHESRDKILSRNSGTGDCPMTEESKTAEQLSSQECPLMGWSGAPF